MSVVPTRIAILGLGNLMRSDDAVGMLTISILSEHPRLPRTIEVIPGGSLGLALLECLRGITHLIAIDAVDAGVSPGSVLQFRGAELASVPVSKSVHLLGLRDLLDALAVLGECPERVVLLGIQPLSTEWGTELSAPVQAAMPELLEQVLEAVASGTSDGLNGAFDRLSSQAYPNQVAG